METTRYSWTSFYEELADKLLAFRADRQALIEKLWRAYETIDMKLPKLDSDDTLRDIDPFTVFGLFNKGITSTNRQKIAASLASQFDVTAAIPNDFDGVPLLNNLNATFYAFSDNARRGEKDIDRLWDTFEAALSYSDNPNEGNRVAFSSAYDSVLRHSLGWKITMGLYWVRPNAFVNLDSRNRWFLELPEKMPVDINNEVKALKNVPEAAEYLKLRDQILAAMKSGAYEYKTFPELSFSAWETSEDVNKQNREKEEEAQKNSLGDAGVEATHYWLYAPGEGGCMWDDFRERGVMGLGWKGLGDLSAYQNKKSVQLRLQELSGSETPQKNSAHAVWQFVHDVKPGDVIFAKRGRTEILGRGVVTGDYEYDPDGGRFPNVRGVTWTRRGSWHCTGRFAMKTLTDVTDYPDLVEQIESFFEPVSEGDEEAEERVASYPEYTREQFLEQVYMDGKTYDTLTGLLRSKKNVILQGAPGVGKTFVAKRLAYSMMGEKDASRVEMVQFHQSYSYEDFVEGYRPCAEGFRLERGAFYDFCKKAADDEESEYFFVIDEINRGNLSKIFGELFMLIEKDKRNAKLGLLYSHERFRVPHNVYIIGTMNTADRSLAMLDYALRRRFAFFELEPAFDSEGFRNYLGGIANPKLDSLVQEVKSLNEAIAADESLGEGFKIGHSYFCQADSQDGIAYDDARLSSIVEYELIPMLKEYWFDDPTKVREWSERLRGAIK